jgi:tRNA (guanine-N7-)-methyltransferase
MRTSTKLSPDAAAIEFVPQNYLAPLDLETVFGRTAPLEVDLGCGDGAFLAELAGQDRHKNFLGIERLLGRVRSACRKIAQRGLSNARILRVESSYAVRHLFSAQSVTAFHLLFPDPWPKRRHQRRRIVTTEFLDSIHRALAVNGLLHVASDQTDYFEQIQQCALNSGFAIVDLKNVAEPGKAGQLLQQKTRADRQQTNGRSWATQPVDPTGCRFGARQVDLPPTRFESQFQERGIAIHRLVLRKVSEVR